MSLKQTVPLVRTTSVPPRPNSYVSSTPPVYTAGINHLSYNCPCCVQTYHRHTMAQIAIARPLSALSNSGYRSNFTSSPTIKDTIGFGLPSKVVNGNVRYERPLGDSEQSYYFQSRAEGVNDM
jgi:hypothetical protein